MEVPEEIREELDALARLRDEERERRLEAESVVAGLEVLLRADNPDTLFRDLLAVFRETLQFEDAWLLQRFADPLASCCELETLFTTYEPREVRWRCGEMTQGLDSGQAVIFDDVSNVPEWSDVPYALRASTGSALHASLGTNPPCLLICIHSTPGFFNEGHLRRLHRLDVIVRQAFRTVEGLYRAQREAAQAARRFARFPAENPEPVIETDLDYRLLFANPSSGRVLNALELELGDCFAERWQNLIASAVSEKRTCMVADTTFDVRAVVSGEEGKIRIYLNEVSDREAAQRSVTELTERFQVVTDFLGLGVAVADAKGLLQDCNQNWCDWFGIADAQQIAGMSAALHDRQVASCLEDGEAFLASAKRLRASDGAMSERVVHQDGRILAVGAIPVRHQGQFLGRIWKYQDITEHQNAADALRESEARYRQIFESTQDLIQSVSTDGRILFCNRRWFETLHYTTSEVHGLSFEEILEPGCLDACRGVFQTAMSGEVVEGVRATFLRRDGSSVQVEGNVVPRFESMALDRSRTGESKVVGLHCFFRDITERLEMEEALKRSRAELTQAQKMEAIGRLAGGVAHDFNNMLAVIMANADLLLEDEKDDERREDIKEVIRAAERAGDLTQQLLAFSRKAVVKPIVLDLNQIVIPMERMLRRLIRADIEISIRPSSRPAFVRVDRVQLEQAIVNMVVNACHAIGEQGAIHLNVSRVALDSDTQDDSVTLAPGPYVRLDVVDNGSGIEPAALSRIFEPFFTTKAPGKGTGLGLSTTYGLVKQLGGDIRVRSTLGEGTTFQIFLPQHASGPGVMHSMVSQMGPALRPAESLLVLLVEDEPMVRRIAEQALTRVGYMVLVAADATEAVTMVERVRKPIDLLLTDVIMPGITGVELAHKVSARFPLMRVLLMSGYADDVTATIPTEWGLLRKPFTGRRLRRAVAEALESQDVGVDA